MPKVTARLQTDQGYQVFDRLAYFTIDHHMVELGLSRHLGPRSLQPALLLLGRLGATPDQPAYQFLP